MAVKQCYIATISTKAALKEVQLIKEEHEVLEDVQKDLEAKVLEDLIHFELDEPSLNHFFLRGTNLEEREKTKLIQFFTENIEVFAWTHLRDVWDRPQFRQTQVERSPRSPTSETKRKKVHDRVCECGDRRD